jgi:hypothetical protein
MKSSVYSPNNVFLTVSRLIDVRPMDTEYIIQKRVLNTDFILSKTKKARKLKIKENEEGAILQIKLKDGSIIYEIPLKNVLEADIIRILKFHRSDKLIQIIFTEDRERLRIMRLNIHDKQIDSLYRKVHELILKTHRPTAA